MLRMASWPAGNAVTALWRRRAMRRASCARFTFNQPVSALFAESLQWAAISHVDFLHCKRASHDEFPVDCSPWREHGHSDRRLIETHKTVLVLADASKSIHSLVYGRRWSCCDNSERYFRPKATHKNPHRSQGDTEIGAAAAIIPVPPSRRGSLEHDSVISFATLADPRRSTQARRQPRRNKRSRL